MLDQACALTGRPFCDRLYDVSDQGWKSPSCFKKWTWMGGLAVSPFIDAMSIPSVIFLSFIQSIPCCNLSGGVALIVWFTTNGMCVKNKTIIYVARASNSKRDCDVEALLILTWERLNVKTSVREERLQRMISIVACCRSAKLCAHAARDFRSQHPVIDFGRQRMVSIQPYWSFYQSDCIRSLLVCAAFLYLCVAVVSFVYAFYHSCCQSVCKLELCIFNRYYFLPVCVCL